MELRFNINQAIETELYYGLYTIYILGGHHVKTNPDFFMQIENITTGEDIELTEKWPKARDFKNGKKAVKFYEFQINEYGKFKITAHNYEDIIIKDSILEVFDLFPFSILNRLNSVILGRSQKAKNINEIEILIH